MKELIDNINEFLESGEDNFKKNRYNATVLDFFKAIVIICDFLIYKEIKLLPKNHKERFSLLKRYFPKIYSEVSPLFKKYTQSYNFKSNLDDASKIRNYANELKKLIKDKE